METSERQALSRFLDQLADLVDDALQDQHAHWFRRGLRELLDEAWRTEVRPKIDDIKSAIDDPKNDAALDFEGFSGHQLTVKMAVWDRRPRMNGLRSVLGLVRPLQGALKIANAILGSMSAVVPAAGAVDEFKKMLEGALDIGDGRAAVKSVALKARNRFRKLVRRGRAAPESLEGPTSPAG